MKPTLDADKISEVIELINRWHDSPSFPPYSAVMIQYKYTSKGLPHKKWKGVDLKVASMLMSAAERSGKEFLMFQALLERRVEGPCEDDGSWYNDTENDTTLVLKDFCSVHSYPTHSSQKAKFEQFMRFISSETHFSFILSDEHTLLLRGEEWKRLRL